MFRQMRFETNGLQGKYVWGLPACRNCKLIESLLLFSWVAVWNDISSDKPSMEPHFTAIHVQRLGYYFNCGWAGAKSFLPPIWDGWNLMGCLKKSTGDLDKSHPFTENSEALQIRGHELAEWNWSLDPVAPGVFSLDKIWSNGNC